MGEIDTDPERIEQYLTTGLFDPSGVAILASFDPWVVTHGYSHSSPSGMEHAAQLLNSTAVLCWAETVGVRARSVFAE